MGIFGVSTSLIIHSQIILVGITFIVISFGAEFSVNWSKMAAAGVQVSVQTEASEVEVEDQDIPLFVKTFEEAEKVIKHFELREVARFASWKSDNAFAKDNGKARSRPTQG